eukprot:2098151-Rhodomonas_salina.1
MSSFGSCESLHQQRILMLFCCLQLAWKAEGDFSRVRRTVLVRLRRSQKRVAQGKRFARGSGGGDAEGSWDRKERVFRVSTFGESHCAGVGCIVDGVPPRMQLTEADIQVQLDRRRPGQAGAGSISTGRNEADAVQILSGTEKGFTLGTPIG